MSDFSEENFRNELLSCELQKLYKDLFKSLLKESCVKHLKNLSMNEVSSVIENCVLLSDKEYQKRKMHFAEIKTLTGAIDCAITNLINNAFSDSYRKELQMKISEALINASSTKSPENSKMSSTRMPVFNSEYGSLNDKEDIEELSIMSKRYVENLRNISQEMIDMPFQEALSAPNIEDISSIVKIKEEKYDSSDLDLDDASSISVSSVHTSALSSFDDEISISSDEETGRKRKRLSLRKINKEAEILHRGRNKSASVIKDNKNEKIIDSDDSDYPINVDGFSDDEVGLQVTDKSKKSNKRVLTEPENLQNASSTSQHKRIRKPNLKYTSEDMVSPFSLDALSYEKDGKGDSTISEPKISRKRGRPRKSVE